MNRPLPAFVYARAGTDSASWKAGERRREYRRKYLQFWTAHVYPLRIYLKQDKIEAILACGRDVLPMPAEESRPETVAECLRSGSRSRARRGIRR